MNDLMATTTSKVYFSEHGLSLAESVTNGVFSIKGGRSLEGDLWLLHLL